MTQSASPLTLMPGKVGIGTLRKIYRDGISVELDPSCQAKVQAASDIVMAAANGKDPQGSLPLSQAKALSGPAAIWLLWRI